MSTPAYRVASLLRQGNSSDFDGEKSTLAKLTRDVETFLSHASNVPPVVLETPNGGDNNDAKSTIEEPAAMEVHLNVVAGVLEPREPTSDVSRVDGLLLPTTTNHETLDRQHVREAQALLNLMGALSPTTVMGNLSQVASTTTTTTASWQGEMNVTGTDEDTDSVAVYDAEDLNDDTSTSYSDESRTNDQGSTRIVELN
ncbi:uncharacterized protein TM35_000043120 [Trypanosoma theileri]|uniref:Uncharacterized protein n=1 Tax=Trypanosoma theileri TaxID=67003 RepID=A0A1X0P5H7_9TRYP|nr:uncharacterized protein TM35_000043120 [Trypanosoma theileri]ORC92098.1 hypothetical protein TM35_000043120 [Trypanosoma theileri]